jgi:SPX domain protein involved in polyphosphate accumulation
LKKLSKISKTKSKKDVSQINSKLDSIYQFLVKQNKSMAQRISALKEGICQNRNQTSKKNKDSINPKIEQILASADLINGQIEDKNKNF